jgi:hypothetical protein
VTTIKTVEGIPEARPTIALPMTFFELNAAGREAVWQRLESWVSYRWGVRSCVFIVEAGSRRSWRPPLHPFTVELVEAWVGDAWEAVSLAPDYTGGVVLEYADAYRFTGTLGTDDAPPADVVEAYRRLAEHFAAIRTHSPMLGSSKHEQHDGGRSIAIERAPTWTARAMQNSGAADLLRAYRRAP